MTMQTKIFPAILVLMATVPTIVLFVVLSKTFFSPAIDADKDNESERSPDVEVPVDAEVSSGVLVTVLDAHGKPVPGATVSIDSGLFRTWDGKADKNGRVIGFLENFHDSQRKDIRPATLLARSPDGQGVQSQPLLPDERKVVIPLRFPVVITGRMVDKDSGEPIPDVLLHFEPPNRTQVRAEHYPPGEYIAADEQGNFRYGKMIPGEEFRIAFYKSLSEENPQYRRFLFQQTNFTAGRGDTGNLGELKKEAVLWKITSNDRFHEALLMEAAIPRLDNRFDEMFKRAKKNGRNVLFYAYPGGAQNVYENNLPKVFLPDNAFDSYEFVTLHAPNGITRESRTSQVLSWMAGRNIHPEIYAVALTADRKFLGLCNRGDVHDQVRNADGNIIHERLKPENLLRFLEQHAPGEH